MVQFTCSVLRKSGLILLDETLIQCGSPRKPFKTRQFYIQTCMINHKHVQEESAMSNMLYNSMQGSLHAYGQSYSTFSFLPIGQAWRYNQFPLLSRAHVLQAFIPSLDHFFDAQCKPYWLLVTLGSTGGRTQRQWTVTGLEKVRLQKDLAKTF